MSRSVLIAFMTLLPGAAAAHSAPLIGDGAPVPAIQVAQVSENTGGATAAPTAPAEPPAKPAAATAVREASGLDARTRRLSDLLARALKALPGDHRDQRFAVVPFTENDPDAKERRLGVVVGDLILTNMVRDHRLSFIERGRLGDILDEQALGETGVLDTGNASKVGAVLDVNAIITGEISDIGDYFSVSARVVDVESAEVRASETMQLPKEELIAVSADAVVLKSRAGAAFRSLVAPGWGQVYNGEPLKAGLIGGGIAALAATTLVAVATGAVFNFLYVNWTLPDDQTFTKEEQAQQLSALRGYANAGYIVGLVFLSVTGVVWVAGALEAYISGRDVDTLDDAMIRE